MNVTSTSPAGGRRARRLAADGRHDPEIEHVLEVQATLDRIYEA